jgi:hypothetical protein
MFRATHRSSSGAQKLYLLYSWVGTTQLWQWPATTDVCKPEAADTVFELLMMSDVPLETCWAIRNGIINSNTWSHLVGYFKIIYIMMHLSMNMISCYFFVSLCGHCLTSTLLWVTSGVQPSNYYHFTRLQIKNWTFWPSLISDWSTLLFLSANQWLHWPSVPTHPPATAFFMGILTLEDETTVLSSSESPSVQWCGTTYQKSGDVNCTTSKA